MNEPIHPTYGTLDQLLAVIKQDVRDGYEVRIGLLGALAWFCARYGERRTADNSAAAQPESRPEY